MHVLVTGAAGFCGRHIVKALAAAGHRVTAHLGRTGAGEAMPAGCEAFIGDLAFGIEIPAGVEAVVHTAARSPGPGIVATAGDFVRANVLGTEQLAQAAESAGVKRVVFFSSISVFGRVAVDVLEETTQIVDPGPYGISKRLGEISLSERRFASLSIRLPSVVGSSSVRNWLSTMIEQSRAGREITYFNADSLYNNAVHIDALSTLVVGALETGWGGHDMIVLGAKEPVTVREVVRTIANAGGNMSRCLELEKGTAPFMMSNKRAMERFGFQPMTMRETLARFVSENGLPCGGQT